MTARKQKQWKGVGLFDLHAGLLIAVRGADPQSFEEIQAIAKKEGGTIAYVTISLSKPKRQARKVK